MSGARSGVLMAKRRDIGVAMSKHTTRPYSSHAGPHVQVVQGVLHLVAPKLKAFFCITDFGSRSGPGCRVKARVCSARLRGR